MRILSCLAVLLASLIISTSVEAQTYFKWVDDQGTVHFTSEPPQDRAFERIDTDGNIIVSYDAAQTTSDNQDDENAANEAQMPREGQPDPEELAASCAQSRENLFWLENRRRIAVENPDGSEDFVEGDARLQMIEETKAYIDEWCQDVPG